MKWFGGSSNTKQRQSEQLEIDHYQKLLEAKSYDIYFYTKGNETACMVYEPYGGMRFSFGVLGRSKLDAIKDAYRIAYNQNQRGIRRVDETWRGA